LLYRTFSVFMPKSALDKQVLCPAKDTETEDVGTCPFMKRMNATSTLPDFLGGSMKCPASLVPLAKRVDKMERITVRTHGDKTVELDVPIPCEITWNVQVESYGIVLGAKFVAEGDEKEKHEEKILLEEVKVKAEDGLQIYKFMMDQPGKVLFLFNNNHSRFRSKAIKYRTDVKALETDKEVQEGSQ